MVSWIWKRTCWPTKIFFHQLSTEPGSKLGSCQEQWIIMMDGEGESRNTVLAAQIDWFGLILWHINHCRLFNATLSLYISIRYIWFWIEIVDSIFKRACVYSLFFFFWHKYFYLIRIILFLLGHFFFTKLNSFLHYYVQRTQDGNHPHSS